jgi:hypothetical protein
VIQVDEDKYVILFCEGYTKPEKIALGQVRRDIEEDVREKKERAAMAHYFEHLQDSAAVDNYLAGTSHAPVKQGVGSDAKSVAPAVYSTPLGK